MPFNFDFGDEPKKAPSLPKFDFTPKNDMSGGMDLGEMGTDITDGLTEEEARMLCSDLIRFALMQAAASAVIIENAKMSKGGYTVGAGTMTLFRQTIVDGMNKVQDRLMKLLKLMEKKAKGDD